MTQRLDRKSFIKYIAALLLFGFNGIVASNISIPSYDIVFLRTMIGSALLLIIFLVTGGKFHVLKYRRDALFIVLSGIAMGTSWMFLYEAYQQIGVSISSLLYYCGPVIVMILSPVIFKEKLTGTKIVGFVVVLIGIFLLNGKAVANGLNPWGLLCGGISAVLYFFMVTLNKQSNTITGMENSVIQLVVSFFAVAVFVGIKQHFVFDVPSLEWPWIVFLGLINTGLGCYLYFSPLAKLPAQTVAVCGYLEPLSAVVFSALILHESMTSVQIVGAVMMIRGAMIGELVKSRR